MKKRGAEEQRPSKQKKVGRQCAALPFRFGQSGDLELMLLTSRGTGRWVIPKGWVSVKNKEAHSAAVEAFEEGGVLGKMVSKAPIGTYRYEKRLPSRRKILCEVVVFPLRVDQQLEVWPEKLQREVLWTTPTEAASLVEEPELASLLRGFDPALITSSRGKRTHRGR